MLDSMGYSLMVVITDYTKLGVGLNSDCPSQALTYPTTSLNNIIISALIYYQYVF